MPEINRYRGEVRRVVFDVASRWRRGIGEPPVLSQTLYTALEKLRKGPEISQFSSMRYLPFLHASHFVQVSAIIPGISVYFLISSGFSLRWSALYSVQNDKWIIPSNDGQSIRNMPWNMTVERPYSLTLLAFILDPFGKVVRLYLGYPQCIAKEHGRWEASWPCLFWWGCSNSENHSIDRFLWKESAYHGRGDA